MDPLETFAENLRRARKAAGLSQMELARGADVDLTLVGRIERATVDPSVRTVARLARGLGVEVMTLFEGVPHADENTPRKSPPGSRKS